MKREKLTEFAIWMLNQRAIDIQFYGVNCVDKLVEHYLEEKHAMDKRP